MPARDIKPSCRSSETLARISAQAERLFWRLLTAADDFGRFDARASVVRAECFQVMLDKIRTPDVQRWLEELATAGLIHVYSVGGRPYGEFVTWAQHQRQRATNSKWPSRASSDSSPSSADIRRQPPANALEEPVVPEEPENTEDTEDTDAHEPPIAARARPRTNGFAIPEQILHALGRAPRLNAVASLHALAFWQAELRANPGVELDREILKAEAYLTANPDKHYTRLSTFLHRWFSHANRPEGYG